MRTITRILFIFFLCSGVAHFTKAQDVESVGVSSEQYAQLGEELDYSKTRRKIVIKKSDEEGVTEEFELDKQSEQGDFFSLLAFIIVGILVGFIIYIVFSRVKIEKKIKPVEDQAPMQDELQTIDTEEGYLTAIRTGDYRLAVRMHFLKVLQYLSDNKYISWEPEKTNGHYLSEIRQTSLYPLVRQLVHIYELVWYGNTTLDEAEFKRVDPLFEAFFKVRT